MQVPEAQPVVLVVSGPSGVGKDSVVEKLREIRPDMHFVVTATSRYAPAKLHDVPANLGAIPERSVARTHLSLLGSALAATMTALLGRLHLHYATEHT